MESAATLSAAAGVFAAVFAILQLWHIEQHRNLEMSIKLFEWAESHRLSKAFRWVEKELHFEDSEKYKVYEETTSELCAHAWFKIPFMMIA